MIFARGAIAEKLPESGRRSGAFSLDSVQATAESVFLSAIDYCYSAGIGASFISGLHGRGELVGQIGGDVRLGELGELAGFDQRAFLVH